MIESFFRYPTSVEQVVHLLTNCSIDDPVSKTTFPSFHMLMSMDSQGTVTCNCVSSAPPFRTRLSDSRITLEDCSKRLTSFFLHSSLLFSSLFLVFKDVDMDAATSSACFLNLTLFYFILLLF